MHVPYNDVEALENAVDETTALVLIEPIQGEGGVHVGSREFLRAARRRSTATGALLAFDEVQTGLGRTGRLFAFEHSGVVPDLLLLAKSLGGGLPIGATVLTQDVASRFRGSHHSTFGGNPLACAAGSAVLRVLVRDRLAERAERLGRMAMRQFGDLASDTVREVRGQGLMIGIECRRPARPFLAELENRGFLAISAGATVMRLLPPLVIPEADWEAGIAAVRAVVANG